MTAHEQFKAFKDSIKLSNTQLAEIFGVCAWYIQRWYTGKSPMPVWHQATLQRLCSEDYPAISPSVSRETRDTFYAAKKALLAGEEPIRQDRRGVYRFPDLEIGESFTVESCNRRRTINGLTSSVRWWRGKLGRRFKLKYVLAGVSVTRIE